MMKRINRCGMVVLIIAAFLLVATLGTSAAEKRIVRYWTGWTGFEAKELQKIIDDFNATHPNIEVRMTNVWGQYDKFLTAVAGGDPPEVASCVWTSQIAPFAARDALLPLDQYIKRDKIDPNDFMPGLWRSFDFEGHIYGMAATTNSTMIAYNKGIFREVGLDPNEPPRTLDELNKAIDKTTKIDKRGYIERIGYLPSSLYHWGLVFGGNFYDEAKHRVTANDPHIVSALEWLGSFAKRYDIRKLQAFQAGFGARQSPNNPFFVGKQVMVDAGEWQISEARRYAPKLDFAFFPAPPPAGGRKNVTIFEGSMFVIPKGSKYPDEAWEFIKYITGPEASERFCYALQNISPRKKVAYMDKFTKDPRFKMGIDLLAGENAYGPIRIPVADTYYAEMAKAVDYVRQGQKTAKQALDDLTKLVQGELDQFYASKK
ncbi:MAG: ABC transporter substrate-binding protein [Firmicutes bacterium]|nr:ABC transporter substrate-binding protein [Bacillota bacterium]